MVVGSVWRAKTSDRNGHGCKLVDIMQEGWGVQQRRPMATMLKTSGNVEHVGFWVTFNNGATVVGQRPGQGDETGGGIVAADEVGGWRLVRTSVSVKNEDCIVIGIRRRFVIFPMSDFPETCGADEMVRIEGGDLLVSQGHKLSETSRNVRGTKALVPRGLAEERPQRLGSMVMTK